MHSKSKSDGPPVDCLRQPLRVGDVVAYADPVGRFIRLCYISSVRVHAVALRPVDGSVGGWTSATDRFLVKHPAVPWMPSFKIAKAWAKQQPISETMTNLDVAGKPLMRGDLVFYLPRRPYSSMIMSNSLQLGQITNIKPSVYRFPSSYKIEVRALWGEDSPDAPRTGDLVYHTDRYRGFAPTLVRDLLSKTHRISSSPN